MMLSINPKFRLKRKHFYGQLFFATLYGWLVVLALGGFKPNYILAVVGFTSLGSSAFIVFAAVDRPVASARAMLGAYAISIACGMLCWFAAHAAMRVFPYLAYGYETAAALAFGLTMFLMVFLRYEHPPAAGLALGLATEDWTFKTVFIILLAVILLCLIKRCCRRYLVNLL